MCALGLTPGQGCDGAWGRPAIEGSSDRGTRPTVAVAHSKQRHVVGRIARDARVVTWMKTSDLVVSAHEPLRGSPAVTLSVPRRFGGEERTVAIDPDAKPLS